MNSHKSQNLTQTQGNILRAPREQSNVYKRVKNIIRPTTHKLVGHIKFSNFFKVLVYKFYTILTPISYQVFKGEPLQYLAM